MYAILSAYYNEYNPEKGASSRSRKAQELLHKYLESLFSKAGWFLNKHLVEIVELQKNYKIKENLVVDFFVEKHKLAFDYVGESYYLDSKGFHIR